MKQAFFRFVWLFGMCLVSELSYAYTALGYYNMTAYITISESVDYTIAWTKVFLNLVKGQQVAEKLMAELTSKYPHSTSQYRYDGETITLSLNIMPDTPYANISASDEQGCKDHTFV